MKHIVLVGNQNCGKTTLFNALTGLDQHTGNWPGVTVSRKSGMLRGLTEVEVTDLPGTYSIHPYTEEECVTGKALLDGGYDAIVNVVDATCLARGLYLTRQLKQLSRPVILALNMMDEVRRAGMHIDVSALSVLLDMPVIPLTARTGEGIDALRQAIRKAPEKRASAAQITPPPIPTAGEIDAAYRNIDALLAKAVTQGRQTDALTARIDGVLLQTPLGLPILALLLMMVLWLAFGPLSELLKAAFDALITRAGRGAGAWMQRSAVSPWLHGLITEGLLAGVGSVLSFLPTILLLLTGLSLLEDSGVMARAVYLLDRPMRRFGLSGRAFIPLLLGFGCTVPAAMAVRSMSGRRERLLTTLLLPFMSCGAKLPVYALLAQAFFPGFDGLVVAALYAGGILLSLTVAMLVSRWRHSGEAAPLLMELPAYRLPTVRSVVRGMWDRAGEFLRRAFSVILLATVAVWLMQHHTWRMAWTDEMSRSILGRLAGWLAPLLAPLGFGAPEAAAALMTGVLAKESIISTLAVLVGPEGIPAMFDSTAAAVSFLTFVLLYSPCVAALSAMGESMGRKRYALYAAFGQTAVAWGAAYLVYHVAGIANIL